MPLIWFSSVHTDFFFFDVDQGYIPTGAIIAYKGAGMLFNCQKPYFNKMLHLVFINAKETVKC